MLILCIWLQVIIKVKVTHQGEGHIKVKVKISTCLPILCSLIYFDHVFTYKGLNGTNKVMLCKDQGEMKLKIN